MIIQAYDQINRVAFDKLATDSRPCECHFDDLRCNQPSAFWIGLVDDNNLHPVPTPACLEHAVVFVFDGDYQFCYRPAAVAVS